MNTASTIASISKDKTEAFYLLSPDGFTLSYDAAPYTSIEEAKADFEEWVKAYESQGYYSSVKYGRIPLSDLWEYMIFDDQAFYPVQNE